MVSAVSPQIEWELRIYSTGIAENSAIGSWIMWRTPQVIYLVINSIGNLGNQLRISGKVLKGFVYASQYYLALFTIYEQKWGTLRRIWGESHQNYQLAPGQVYMETSWIMGYAWIDQSGIVSLSNHDVTMHPDLIKGAVTDNSVHFCPGHNKWHISPRAESGKPAYKQTYALSIQLRL